MIASFTTLSFFSLLLPSLSPCDACHCRIMRRKIERRKKTKNFIHHHFFGGIHSVGLISLYEHENYFIYLFISTLREFSWSNNCFKKKLFFTWHHFESFGRQLEDQRSAHDLPLRAPAQEIDPNLMSLLCFF